MKFSNIIFDFDGVLADTRPGVVDSFRKMVQEISNESIQDDYVADLIGKPLAEIVSTLLKTENQEQINKGINSFKKHYQENGVYNNFIYDDIENLLKDLNKNQFNLFIVSNKIELFLKKILKQHKLEKYFYAIKGTDGMDRKSKKSDYLKDILDTYNLERNRSLIVGDTTGDISAGKANDIYCLGVTWGYGLEQNLIQAEADSICHTPKEVLNQIKNKDH